MEKKLIKVELNNKLLQKSNFITPRLTINSNFNYSDAKLLKQLIAIEMFSGFRPKITANLLNSMLIINLSNLANAEYLRFLKKSTVIWNNYIENTYNSSKQLTLNHSRIEKFLKFSDSFNQTTKKNLLIKSAYFD